MDSVRWVSSMQDMSEDLWTDCFPPPLEGRWWHRALGSSGLKVDGSFISSMRRWTWEAHCGTFWLMCDRPASALILSLIALIVIGLHGCSIGLLHAVDQGDSAAVSSLLDGDLDANAQFPIIGSRPLILAAAKGHQEMVGLLLDRGAQVNASDYTGWTSLHAAIYGGHAEVVQLLLERGADFEYAYHWYLVSPLALAESLARDSDDRKKVVDVLQSFKTRLAARHPGR